MKLWMYIMESLGIIGLVGLISYITWTKMALGAALSLLGAFFPELHIKEGGKGEGTIDIGKVKVVFRGGLRFVVVIAGLVLIVGAVLDGHQGYKQNQIENEIKTVEKFDALMLEAQREAKENDNRTTTSTGDDIDKIINKIRMKIELREKNLREQIKED